ncbi:MAG: farnesyl diphosphate synthase [Clostridia bacterium]|nr:farnesyl diphosphate synthase [Clostridia bacterium]
MEFKDQLKVYQEIINNELEKYLRKEDVPEKVLNNSMEYSLMASGKRIRPILVIATYKIFNKNVEKCMPYAVAIEMVHNFSLIHDDLPGIDNDDFRHGKPTNHKQFNEATAILAGDGLLNQAYIVISEDLKKSNNEELKSKIQVFSEFSNAVDRMIAGEYIDTEYEGKQISDDYLEYIHKNKTGALLRLCVRMGAILANVTEKDLERLTSYAEKIGLAFQIKDDILSEEGDEKVLGKPVGNDKELEKCTYVSKYGLDGAKDILEKITKEAIEEVSLYGEKAEFLKQLALYIKNRNK